MSPTHTPSKASSKPHGPAIYSALGIEALDAVDEQILNNIKNVAVQEFIIGHDMHIHHREDLKHLLFSVAFALVAKPFGNDFARLPQSRVEKLKNTLLYAMALDVTSIENPEAATADDVREALYAQTRQVAEYMHQQAVRKG